MNDELELTSLDDLFREAKREMKKAHKELKKASVDNTTVKAVPSSLYTDPRNWIEGRAIALISKESSTLLGVFRELLHVSVNNCRRLVRAPADTPIDAVETISGIVPSLPAIHSGSIYIPQVRRVATLLELDFGNQAITEVDVHFHDGGIERVVLTEDTGFSSDTGILELPAGTNILPMLTRESKKAVKTELEWE